MDWDITVKDLVFAATARCACGAGMAYVRDGRGMDAVPSPFKWPYSGYWECSAILLGDAVPSIRHTDRLPFAVYELKAESDPSARGASTRPE